MPFQLWWHQISALRSLKIEVPVLLKEKCCAIQTATTRFFAYRKTDLDIGQPALTLAWIFLHVFLTAMNTRDGPLQDRALGNLIPLTGTGITFGYTCSCCRISNLAGWQATKTPVNELRLSPCDFCSPDLAQLQLGSVNTNEPNATVNCSSEVQSKEKCDRTLILSVSLLILPIIKLYGVGTLQSVSFQFRKEEYEHWQNVFISKTTSNPGLLSLLSSFAVMLVQSLSWTICQTEQYRLQSRYIHGNARLISVLSSHAFG